MIHDKHIIVKSGEERRIRYGIIFVDKIFYCPRHELLLFFIERAEAIEQ